MTLDAQQRADDLLRQMTLEEKIDYIGGNQFSVRAIERLGIPEIVMSDGPMGCRCYGKAACFPAGIALAATWNTDCARKIGEALGRQCRARGVHILLAPGVNIYRSPKCGRNFEYLGEDPYLASTMVVPEIKAVQSQGVLATIKHLACNNQEWDRHNIDSVVDERTLREIYLPAFKAAIQKAKSRCLMTAYNLLNGVHCSQHDYLIKDILKGEWDFDGFVMSDWTSCYDAVGITNAGLDLEMPTGEYMNKENLIPAIKDGRVSEATIDDKIRRMLRIFIAAGFFDRPQLDESIQKDDPQSDKTALEVARESIVLLKNENNVLPLDRNKVKSVAVVGPNAHPAIYCAGGSAFTEPFHLTSIFEGIRETVDSSVAVLRPSNPGFAGPLKMEVFDNRDLQGEPKNVSEVNDISFDWCQYPPEGASGLCNYSVRWTGKIHPNVAGEFIFNTKSDDGVRVFLDNKLIIDDWSIHEPHPVQASVDLENRDYDICVEYFQAEGGACISFGWKQALSNAGLAESLKDVDAIVYCAGFNRETEGEGYDRPFELPLEQVEEIRELAKVHPKVIVVLNTGGGVAWDGWLEHVPAVIEAWYPGQAVGRVVSEVIFGKTNPSGKLPATYEKRWEDNPTAPYYNINDNGKTPYSEGIFVGYRGYDKNNTEPQFCFGYGLSYTTFEFSDLRIAEKGTGDSRTIEITCSVKNTGNREGAEVAQLYVGDEKCSVQRPIRELKGFCKVRLGPGESKEVSFTLTKDDLAFYSVDKCEWVTEPGEFKVWIGSSSRDLPLQGKFVW
jgi:beta-glucosidase